MISMHQEGSEERWKEPFIGHMDSLPDRVGDSARTRGGSIRILRVPKKLRMAGQVVHP